MAFIPTLTCVKAAIESTLFSQTIVNTLWFSFNAIGNPEPTTTDMQTLATYLISWVSNDYVTGISEDLVVRNLNLTRQDSTIAPSVDYPINDVPGNIAGTSLPSSDAACISFKTGERGRSARGRNYISGIPRTLVTGNTISNTFLTNMEDAYDLLVNTTPLGWNWVVVSHVNGGVNRAFGLKQTILDAVFADNILDVQRRRGTGRGS